jgi:Tfp pilus assembly protein PilE
VTNRRCGFTLLETLFATLILTLAAVALLPLQRTLIAEPQRHQATNRLQHLAASWTWEQWQILSKTGTIAPRETDRVSRATAERWSVNIEPVPSSSVYLLQPIITEATTEDVPPPATTSAPIWHLAQWRVVNEEGQTVADGSTLIAAPIPGKNKEETPTAGNSQ